MHKQDFHVTCLSDIVITADSATTGGHTGLDYLPGALFLGAAAACIIANGGSFNPDLLLSGRVRFLNGYPALKGKCSIPIPLCFHGVKGEAWQGCAPWNGVTDTRENNDQQLEQWRHGFMLNNGRVVEIKKTRRMKNAIDRQMRRNAEGQLFGYEAIQEGSEYIFQIQADTKEDMEHISSILTEPGIRLGRSRSAEYGNVRITRHTDAEKPHKVVHHDRLVVFFLLSDTELVRNGQPILMPKASDLGLPDGKVIHDKCYIRTRRYSPWNAFLNCYMPERQVLCKGSVVVIESASIPDLEKLQGQTSCGIGIHCEEGLGQVLINPEWIFSAPALQVDTAGIDSVSLPKPQSRLIEYLESKASIKDASGDALVQGIAWAKDWLALSLHIANNADKVPSKSQWAAIRELAIRHMYTPRNLRNALDEYCGNAMRKELWVEACVRRQRQTSNLLEAMKSKLGENPDNKACLALHHAAIEMSRQLDR